ncbi:hypothetical protein Tco_0664707 [Tanacetum coccineum]
MLPSDDVLDNATYSASADDIAVQSCFFDIQLTNYHLGIVFLQKCFCEYQGNWHDRHLKKLFVQKPDLWIPVSIVKVLSCIALSCEISHCFLNVFGSNTTHGDEKQYTFSGSVAVVVLFVLACDGFTQIRVNGMNIGLRCRSGVGELLVEGCVSCGARIIGGRERLVDTVELHNSLKNSSYIKGPKEDPFVCDGSVYLLMGTHLVVLVRGQGYHNYAFCRWGTRPKVSLATDVA